MNELQGKGPIKMEAIASYLCIRFLSLVLTIRLILLTFSQNQIILPSWLIMKFDRNMDHLENLNPPFSSPHDLDLSQIIMGENDEKCSVQAFLAYMPCQTKCHQVNQPEAKEQLQVFWYPESIPNEIQQKIKSVLLSLPESMYLGTFNLVQFWEPNNTVTAGGGTFLTVSRQPFGVDQLSNGVGKYRYFSVMNGDQVNESDPVGRAFLNHFPGFFGNAFSQQRSFAERCGFKSCWVIPLVRDHDAVCIGVLEFLTREDIRFDFTFVNKFQKLTEHVIGVLNSPSDMGNYSSQLGLRNFVYSHVDPYGATADLRSAPPTEHGIENHMVPFDQNSNFSDQVYEAHHGDFSLAESSFSFPEFAVQNNQTYDDGSSSLANHIYKQHQHGYMASSSNTDAHTTEDHEKRPEENSENYETSETLIGELGSFGSPSETSMGTRTAGKLKIPKAMIVEQYGKNMVDAAHALGVHKSTLKRHCRSYGIQRWPPHKRNKVHGIHSMSVKATYGTFKVKFKIASDIHIEVLRVELGRRFGLEVGSFRIQYKEDSGDLITIPCNEDLWDHISSLNSSKQETMHLLLSPACL